MIRDGVALEPDEEFALVLSPVSPLVTGEGVFFLNAVCITIQDNDSKLFLLKCCLCSNFICWLWHLATLILVSSRYTRKTIARRP